MFVLDGLPTRKTFASSTTKVESEPPNGSNADIPNQCESEQALNVSVGTLLSTGTSFNPTEEGLRNSEFKTTAMNSQVSKAVPICSLATDRYIMQEFGITIPLHLATAEVNSHKVVRLGINPMIQPEPEDLPKDNPKLEIAVLRKDVVELKMDPWDEYSVRE
ncbi:hypothetical protein Tco_0318983 [Tanacetum coccineum]